MNGPVERFLVGIRYPDGSTAWAYDRPIAESDARTFIAGWNRAAQEHPWTEPETGPDAVLYELTEVRYLPDPADSTEETADGEDDEEPCPVCGLHECATPVACGLVKW